MAAIASWRRCFAAAGLMFGLAACTSTSEPVSIDSTTGLPTGAIDTGTYPDLNIVPRPANAQFTPQQQAAAKSRLAAQRSSTQRLPSADARQSAKQLSELEARRKRGEEVLKAIETSE